MQSPQVTFAREKRPLFALLPTGELHQRLA